jgi:N-acetylglucosamine-6-phosphate deacetylase
VGIFLYHFHGLGCFDFSALNPGDLDGLQELAADQGLEILPTVYLRRDALPRFTEVVEAYGSARQGGRLPNIAGFAVEGPLLGPQGGIPRASRWFPTGAEWRELARLGYHGLRYIVMAPDAMELGDEIERGFTFSDLLFEFYDQGTRIALGHFHRDDPVRSARRLNDVLELLHMRYASSPFLVLTDHLFNDMPRNFTHAWRTAEQREHRVDELAKFLDHEWEDSDLERLLGPVPAALLTAAQRELLMPCLNFDGYHVDLEICRKTFDYLGEDRLIALTDHTELPTMAAEPLTQDKYSKLWLRDDGAVAAGSTDHVHQIQNMRSIGLPERAIDKIFFTTPRLAVAYEVAAAARRT